MRARELMPVLVLLTSPARAQEPVAPPAMRPWGAAVFEEAGRTGRPVLLRISDPACPRCRLDEADALADPAATRLTEAEFVTVRVDRLLRPDLDDLFATAAQWVGAARAYPLFVALLPDGRPFAAAGGIAGGDRGDQPGLHRFALRAWSELAHQRAAAETRAAAAADALARAQQVEPAAAADTAAPALRALERSFDGRHGGFGEGDAFAPAATLRLLLTVLERGEDAAARRILERTLDAVAVAEADPPSLARRALLLEAFARASLLTDRPLYRTRAAALADGALALRDVDGAFRAYAQSADAPVLAGWNGLMVGALALSGTALDRPRDLEAARTAAAAVLQRLGPAARLRRSASADAVATLEDHAFLADGLLRLYAASGGRDRRWGDEAAALVDAAIGRWFDADKGGFFDSAGEGYVPPALPQRLRSGYDGELPSANGVMAGVLLRLSRALAQPRYADLSRRTVEAFAGQAQRTQRGMEGLAAVAVDLQPQPSPSQPPASSAAASDVRDGVRFTLEAAPAGAGAVTARLRIEAPPGVYVVAHEPGAPDLFGLAVSVPTEGTRVAGRVLYPTPQRLEGRWNSGAVNVLGATAVVEVPLRADGAGRVRVRAAFQACRDQAARCERPQSVLLEVPISR